MNSGYIKLYRKVLEHPIYSKMQYFRVWLHLLLKANHKDKTFIFNNKNTTVKAGSFIGSLRGISKELKISISTVKMIIDYLISERMIEHKPNNKFSLFTIVQWDLYQSNEHKTARQLNASRTLAETNNNDKNDKNNNTIDAFEKLNLAEQKKFMAWLELKGYDLNLAKELQERIVIWCRQNGKTYKNYIAALQNWLNKERDGSNKPIRSKPPPKTYTEIKEHNYEVYKNLKLEK